MNHPLKIGLLTPAFASVTGLDSGIGTHFRHLADGLSAAGQSVTAIVVSDKAMSVPSLGYDVRPVVVPKPKFARLLGRLSWQLHQWLCLRAAISAATRTARSVDIDVWETTSTGSLALHMLGQAHPAPFAVRVSTTAAQLCATNSGDRHWVSRRIEAWEAATVRRADRVLTHSQSHRDSIGHEFRLSIDRIPIIPHGIPIPSDRVSPPRGDRCRVLFVGRFEHRKGIDLIMGALPEFLSATPHAEVTLVGADSGDHWQMHWRERGPAPVRDRVHFTGVVDAAELSRHYREADLFVAPSRYESFGLMFVEAMGRALPVVALNAPGASDMFEHDVTGVLVPPENPQALAAALQALACDPVRRARIGNAARSVMEERYSLAALTGNSLAFYRSMIAER